MVNKKGEVRMSDAAWAIISAGAGAAAATAVATPAAAPVGAISGVVLVALVKIAPGILWILFAIGGLYWVATTMGSMTTIIVGIVLLVLWILFR
jgi:hypothetical protein